MRFDLTAIDKLSPPGLICLKSITAMISSLLDIAEAGLKSNIGANNHILMISRMVAHQSGRLNAYTLFNFKLRVKAWVLQCPKRITMARQMIGEAAIRKWELAWQVEYLLYLTLKDWNGTWPEGCLDGVPPVPKPVKRTKAKVARGLRTYNWKPFALAELPRFIEFETTPQSMDKAWDKAWLPQRNKNAWLQPREQRTMEPVIFYPRELRMAEVEKTKLAPKIPKGYLPKYARETLPFMWQNVDSPNLAPIYKPP